MTQRYPVQLTALALLISGLAAVPFGYLVLRALEVNPDVWGRLWAAHIPGLLIATVLLVITTIVVTVLLGVGAAWLVERTDLPGRAVWRVLLALPLAIPAYVAALCWIILLRRGGLVDQAAMQIFGLGRGEVPLPSIYSLGGATLAISLCVYPYVFLPASAALRSADRAFEEAARLCGRGAWGAFRTVTLPLIAPAITAGALLVGLYSLADFGTVSMLRYRTFTMAIYQQFGGSIDRSAAAALSLVLVALTIPLLFGESWASRRGQRVSRSAAWRPRSLARLGRWRWPALLALGALATLALGVPAAILGGLSIQGLFFPTEADRIWGINSAGLWRFGLNSLLLAAAAATGATLLALAPAYLAVRFPSRWTHGLLSLSKSAFALPGVIVGLAFVFLLNRWFPLVYGTVGALLIGFVFRLLPQSVATGEAALRGVSPALEQAARTMGHSGLATFRRVTLPIAAPGMIASWVLVFITAMKELPTAILLRPPGFDTLPVRIWAAASESVHTQAAPAAFLLIVLTMACLLALIAYGRFGLERTLHDHG